VNFWDPKIYFSKNDPVIFYAGNRLRAFPNPENAFLTLTQGKIGIFEAKMVIFRRSS